MVHLDTELPRTLAVGRGTCLFVSGTCHTPRDRVSDARLLLDGHGHPRVPIGAPIETKDRAEGFVAFVAVPPVDRPRSAALELEARLADGERVRQPLAVVELVPHLAPGAPPVSIPATGGPPVAICMATFDPEPRLLERQIASIREQTHGAWVCLISDDCSAEARFRDLRSMTARDPRFVLSRSAAKLGFYRNFERALAMVPAGAAFVALADQDDRWYPEKLAELLSHRDDAQLVYSDMRVVDASGRASSQTFWQGRRNNYTNLASLLLANTVTGAASLFRRELLDLVLPFPPQVGRSFHDQWIASVALATGRIAYVDRPLYDYVQHGGASLGHAAALRDYEPRRLLKWSDPRGTARELAVHGRRSYLNNVCRIALAAHALQTRTAGAIGRPKARAVRRAVRLGRPPEPYAWLALRSLRRLAGRNETMGIELSLLAAIAWRRLAAARARRRAATRRRELAGREM
jgi:glycosyltransferase involved in cell wall biosynthesis